EDYLFQRYASDELERIKQRVKPDEDGQISSPSIHKFVETAQRISEGFHFQFREYNLQLEDVANKQREVIYQFRHKIISADAILEFIALQTDTLPSEIIESYYNVDLSPDEIDLQKLAEELNKVLLSTVSFDDYEFENVE